MSENQDKTIQQETPEQLAEIIVELEKYRSRLINDTLEMAKKAKVLKTKAMENIENHPEITQIDSMLADLNSRKAALETATAE